LVRQLTHQQAPPLVPPLPCDTLTVEEAAAFLGISISTVYKLTHRKEVTYHQPGGKLIHFKRSDLEKYRNSRKRTSNNDLQEAAISYINAPKKRNPSKK
jgi:excisionase family DNA binding protein